MRLPQLRGDPDVIRAVAGDELVAANLYPVFRLRHAGSVLRVDAQAKRRSPEEIGDEPHARAVVREHPRTRSLEPLLRHDGLVGFAIEVGLHDAVRPENPGDVDRCAGAQAEVHAVPGDHLFLRQQPAANLDFAADSERVDALIAGGWLRAGAHRLPVVALRALAELASSRADQIELTVPVQILDAGHFS